MTRRRPHPRRRAAAALAGLALLTAACAGSLTDEEVLAANQVASDQAAPSGPGPAGAPGPTGPADPVGGAVGPSSEPVAPVAGGPASPSGPAPSVAPSAGGGASAPSTPGETGPILIASVGNYSGPAGAAQAGIPKGVQVWAAAVNAAGGLFGRPVQVAVVDDGGDPARYAAALRDLVENRKVVAFVGNGASLSMPGGTAYLEGRGVPVIGSDCSVHDWFRSAVYFPQCPTFSAQLESIVPSGVQVTGKKKVGVVTCLESAACRGDGGEVQRGVARAGARIVYQGQISLTQIDFTAECRSAQAAGVDLMFVGADPNTLARFARSCQRQGFVPGYVQASISVAADSVALPGLGSVVVSLPVFPFQGGSGPAYEAYRAAMTRYGPASPGPAHAFGWASAKLFERIATLAAEASGSVSSRTLLAAGHTVAGETLGGLTVPLTFTGPTPTPRPCAFVAQGDGKGGWQAPLGSEARC